MWRSWYSLWELVLSFCYVGPGWHFLYLNTKTERTWVGGKNYHVNNNEKRPGMALQISDSTEFETNYY